MSAESKQPLDHLFRQRLANAEVAPPPFVWKAVERELQRQRRRAIWWWLSGAGAVGALALAASLWWSNAQPAQQTAAYTAPVTAGGGLASVENQPAKAPATAAQPATQTEAPTPTRPVATTPVLPLNSHTSQQNFKTTTEPAPVVRPLAYTASGNTVVPAVAAIEENLPTPEVVVSMPPATLEGTPVSDLNIAATTGNSTTETVENQPVESVRTAVSTLLPTPARWPALQASVKTVQVPRQPFRPYTKRKKDAPKGCYDFDTHRSAWLVDAYAGPLLARQHLEYRGNIEQAAYLGQRQSTESGGWGFQGGLRGTYVFDRHWMIRTGGQYDQFTDVFSYVDPTSIEVLIKQVYDVNTGGLRIDTVDIRFGAERTRVFNRFGMVGVPLELGYEIRSGRKGVSVHGGTTLNVLFWKRGAILSPDTGQPAYFTPGRSGGREVFVSRTSLSANLSAQAFWYLQPRLRVFAEPNVRHVLRSVTLTDHPVQEHWTTWGLRFGLTKIF